MNKIRFVFIGNQYLAALGVHEENYNTMKLPNGSWKLFGRLNDLEDDTAEDIANLSVHSNWSQNENNRDENPLIFSKLDIYECCS